MQSAPHLDELKRQAVSMLQTNRKVQYAFTRFTGQYSELTLYVLNHILAAHRLNFLDNILMAFLRECVTNAVKANLKRAYFDAREADIHDPEQYRKTIEEFKKEGVQNLERYLPIMRRMGLKVQVFMEMADGGLRIMIANNAAMTPEELARVQERIRLASELSSVVEAYDLEDVRDETEGAGLGLLMNVMLLRNAGIPLENFSIRSENGSTRVLLKIPSEVERPEAVRALHGRITAELEDIPTFPESIRRILDLCDSEEAGMDRIAKEIERDPSLSASILKLANSGGFISGSRSTSIQRAASVVGVKNIRQLTAAHASRAILESNYRVYQDFWEHANECALYCRLIAEDLGLRKLADQVYMGGLLHDLGKIVLHAIEPETFQKINGIVVDRTESATAILEEISLGLSHAEVGARLAERWNFSPGLVEMLRNHHSAFAAHPDFAREVSIVHLADAFLQAEKRRARYVFFDIEAMAHLGIADSKALESLHGRIKARSELAGEES